MKIAVMFIPVLLIILSGCANNVSDESFNKVIESATINGIQECDSFSDKDLRQECINKIEDLVGEIPDQATKAFILRDIATCNNAENIESCKDQYYYLLATVAGKDTCSLILNEELKTECGVVKSEV